jgi:hypothetical protein
MQIQSYALRRRYHLTPGAAEVTLPPAAIHVNAAPASLELAFGRFA